MQLLTTVLELVGLAAVCVAVVLLAGWHWGLLAGGIELVAVGSLMGRVNR